MAVINFFSVKKITYDIVEHTGDAWKHLYIHTDEGIEKITLFAKDGKKSNLNIRKAK